MSEAEKRDRVNIRVEINHKSGHWKDERNLFLEGLTLFGKSLAIAGVVKASAETVISAILRSGGFDE